jgi:WD40 repeat protein
LSYDKEQLNVVCRIEGKQLVEESDGVGGVTSACFLGNGHQLAIGVTSPAVVLWDIDNTDSIIRRYIGHTSLITSISRNTKDTHIASGLEDGSLTLHKLTSTQPIATLSSSGDTTKQSIKSVKFSPIESGMIGTCDANGTVKLWSSESQRLLSTFTNIHTGSANDISYSPYNRMLMASAGQNGIICLYDLIQRKIITQISHSSSLTSVLLLKDGVTMLVGTNDGELLVYNMRNCKEPCQVIKAHNKPINSLAAQNQIKVKTSRKMPNKSLKKKVTIEFTNSENITPSFDTPAAVTKIDKSSTFILCV